MTCQEIRHLLHAYLDGEFDLARSLEVEEHLTGCAACQDLQKSQQVLRTAFRSGELSYQAPAAVQARIESAVRGAAGRRRRTQVSPWLWTGVAAAVALAAGLTLGQFLVHSREPDRGLLAQQVLGSHLSLVQAHRPPAVASEDMHTVKPWFQGKLDFSPPVHDFPNQGFSLVGGDLDYVDGRAVAKLVYHRRKHIISLFIWPVDNAADSPPTERSYWGYHLLSWVHSGMAYWAVSDLNPSDLSEFARLVQEAP